MTEAVGDEHRPRRTGEPLVLALEADWLHAAGDEDGDCWGELVPHSGFHLDVQIDFDTAVIGSQRIAWEMSPGVFRNELCRARTFGFMSDVEKLWKAGLALGASLELVAEIVNDYGNAWLGVCVAFGT